MQSSSKSKIFFDGNCIVCDMEIAHYKKIEPDIFEIVDISAADFNAAEFSLNSEDVNRHMHVLTPDGNLLVGVDAFAHIWSRIEKYKLASVIIKKPVIYQLAKIGYKIFAANCKYLPKKK